ncbi:hypothetical protein Celaphus_00010730, partial [Cervus elaphus hippelaphus]
TRLFAPSIKARFPAETYALVGQQVTLECFAFGNPVPRIKWRKVDGSLSPQWATAEPTLQIPSVGFEDEGTYECEAENAKGRDTVQGRIIVQGSPVSTAPHCERPGWHSSSPDAPPRPGAGISAQARVEVLAGDLRFSKLSLEDSGMYQCVAENKHGTIYASAELAVQGKRPRERGRPQGQPGGRSGILSSTLAPDFRLNPVRRLIPAARGGEVVIPCQPRAAPKAVVLWSKGTEILVNSSRVTVTPDGTLIIRNVSRSDEGKYTCFAENFMGKANSTGTLSVRDATKITLAPSSADINLGDNLTLQCHASHDPTMDLTFVWTLDDFPIDSDKPGGHYRRVSVPMSREYQHGGGFGYLVSFRRQGGTSWQTARVPGADAQYFVYSNDSVRPYTPFEVKIRSYNRRGDGPESLVAVVYSAEEEQSQLAAALQDREAPGIHTHSVLSPEPRVAPPKVWAKGVSSSEMNVSWEPVQQDMNGILLGYEVSAGRDWEGKGAWSQAQGHLAAQQSSSQNLSCTHQAHRFRSLSSILWPIRYWKAGDKAAAADRVRTAGLDSSALVTGLHPNTKYHVTVRAYNRAGTGPASPSANATTMKPPPRRPPGNISWTFSSSSLSIKWDPVVPLSNESAVTGYKMLYQNDLHPTPTLHLTSKNRIEITVPEDIGHALVQIRTTGPGGDGVPAEVHIVRNGGTSMMVENSAVCPAPHLDTALTHSVAALVLLGYLQL